MIHNRIFDLRDWQQEAFSKVREYLEAGKRDFLCVATPGAGKTKFALRVAHELMRKGICERTVIVTPTDHLKRQWAATAAKFAGLDIDPDFSNSQGIEAEDYHGIAITYALLGQDKKGIHAQNTFNRRTLVIFDEIHHAGENLTWGNAVKNSFENAVFRLAISGTAFRSDDNEIPFIVYENRMSKADYTYSYERAIRENVCRPVYFSIHDGKMKWKVAEQEFEHSFKDYLTPDQVSKRLKTALDPKGNWVRDVLRTADKKLSEIRRTHIDAAGMIFAATQKHARDLAKVIEEISGEKPPVIISEDAESEKNLDAFQRSSARWLVSVKMVSEGVDIPRLRVGVYLTNVKAELFFRQAIGRFVRVLSHLQWQDAFIFIPKDKEIVKLAEQIQEEREHALDDAKKNGGGESYTDLFGNEYTPALKGKFVPLESVATDINVIEVNVGISSGMKESVDTRIPPAEAPVFLKKKHLREQANALAKRIALRQNRNKNEKPDFRFAHKIWIENGGKSMSVETIAELERRIDFYKKMLRSAV